MDTHPRRPVVLDMTPEGEFREPPAPGRLDRFLQRAGGMAVLVAVVTGGLVLAALALAALTILVPVALVAGIVAWFAIRWRLRRLMRQAAQQGRPGAPVRFVVIRR